MNAVPERTGMRFAETVWEEFAAQYFDGLPNRDVGGGHVHPNLQAQRRHGRADDRTGTVRQGIGVVAWPARHKHYGAPGEKDTEVWACGGMGGWEWSRSAP